MGVKVAGRTTRALEKTEFEQIVKLISSGFNYKAKGKEKKFRANKQVALALTLEATTGLRVSDILQLRVNDFKKDRLEIREKKTNKLQYKKISKNVKNMVLIYAKNNNLDDKDFIINICIRNIQQQLKIVCDYLKLNNISTHSFRKMFATDIYSRTKDIELVSELLNHSSIAITQRYIRINQNKIDEVSESMDFSYVLS